VTNSFSSVELMRPNGTNLPDPADARTVFAMDHLVDPKIAAIAATLSAKAAQADHPKGPLSLRVTTGRIQCEHDKSAWPPRADDAADMPRLRLGATTGREVPWRDRTTLFVGRNEC
jgi:hypothetical protein